MDSADSAIFLSIEEPGEPACSGSFRGTLENRDRDGDSAPCSHSCSTDDWGKRGLVCLLWVRDLQYVVSWAVYCSGCIVCPAYKAPSWEKESSRGRESRLILQVILFILPLLASPVSPLVFRCLFWVVSQYSCADFSSVCSRRCAELGHSMCFPVAVCMRTCSIVKFIL